MFLKRGVLFFTVLALLVFVGQASAESNASPDFDGDGVVDISDFDLFMAHFGSSRGDGTYQAKYDLDGNGMIGIPDFFIFADNFGKTVVTIEDANLRAVIADSLGKASGEVITKGDMATLTFLEARNSDISDLTGLEFATNLQWLDLGGEWLPDSTWINNNEISDFSALSSLTNLTYLDLSGTGVLDISVLSSLDNLTELYLAYTGILDAHLFVLLVLTNLQTLDLSYNNISNISALLGLTNLTYLDLSYNNISNISALSGLTNLTYLDISYTGVSDISPLVENMGLSIGDYVSLVGNSLSVTSNDTHIPALQARGVKVQFSSSQTTVTIADANLRAVIADSLGKASGEVITRGDMATLTFLEARNSDISDLTGLEFATNLQWLDLGGKWLPDSTWVNSNAISNFSALSSLTNLTVLDLSGTGVSDISALSGLTNLTELYLAYTGILDAHLSVLSVLTKLQTLDLSYNSISNISVLSGLTNLDSLNLYYCNISDLAPLVENMGLGSEDYVNVGNNSLSGESLDTHIPALQARGVEVEAKGSGTTVTILDANLRAVIADSLGKAHNEPITQAEMETLTYLEAPNKHIRDLTGLEFATNLQWLGLGGEWLPDSTWVNNNEISDISALSSLTNLTVLDLSGTGVSDISMLSSLTNLTDLYLASNGVLDISVLSSLTNLTVLDLSSTSVSDISVLSRLTNLTALYLANTGIWDAHLFLLSVLTKLQTLDLSYNNISDISALSGLTNLKWLNLYYCNISDLAPLVENMGLGSEDYVNVGDNPLSGESLNTHIPALQARGVEVEAQFSSSKPAIEETKRRMPRAER